jgi:glutamine amidotransferase
MYNLRKRGFASFLKDALARNVPVLAICVGMQLVFDRSDEDGGVEALGILPGFVRRFRPRDRRDKVPHMGWNRTAMPRRHPLLPESLSGADFYFVHSYYPEPAWEGPAAAPAVRLRGRAAGVVYGVTDYAGISFASMAGQGSLFAAQFHPEKSAAAGLDILRRFIAWDGKPCS